MSRKHNYQKKRRQPLAIWLKKYHKSLLLISVSILSFFLVIKATYAWDTYSTSKENKIGNTAFSVKLKEQFTPNNQWEPGRATVKKVYVLNDGNIPAFVRLRAEEFLLLFEMEIETSALSEGSGNVLSKWPVTPTATIERNQVNTWKVNHYYDKQNSGVFYKGEKTIPSSLSIDGKGLVYEWGEAQRQTTDLAFIDLKFGDVAGDDSSFTSNYWRYGNDGYFYYSERLEPGKETSYFLTETFLSPSTPNRIKESLYKLNILMGGDQALKETLSEWGHDSSTDPIYLLLKDKVIPN
ncbi:hypothetical protein I6N95_17540 [Vagococcus sp. BWB3-3]|uniref:Alternate signal-mediated exported protein n=1 Tax=Vagococcus allomyrinae TaxID=2794353 RepID=A0A940SXX6_9ENTE|nr:BsaA family SipW-dependent biofilm matrix protein [Vagococcus allomyrinae]MBP1042823.1 hypothetical protein [Vagococcus allomyrinae]